MKILAFSLIGIALYCMLAIFLKVPAFKASKAFKKNKNSTNLFTDLVTGISKKWSKSMRLNVMKKSKYSKLLSIANRLESPEEFLAKTYTEALLPLSAEIILFFIHPLLLIFPVVLSFFFYNRNMENLKKEGEARMRNIETEILRFVAYMSNALRSSRNIINCIEVYKTNFDTPLTEELTYTLSEMRTGNQETALRNMEKRNNSTAVSRLVRGLLSSMRGDDMSIYFENLGYELTNEWEQNLKRQALKIEPKINKMSFILFGISLLTVFIIMFSALMSANTVFGGF